MESRNGKLSQFQLSPQQRVENLADAFIVGKCLASEIMASPVLLVDDIYHYRCCELYVLLPKLCVGGIAVFYGVSCDSLFSSG
jgi:hypothetical protein